MTSSVDFLNPNALWGLLFIIVPIAVHLFSFKKFREEEFTDLSLLSKVHQSGMAKNKLKKWLVLLSRILLITCLSIAFAQPFLKKEEGNRSGNKLVSIYIDNSYSMSAEEDGVEMLTSAKYLADNLIDHYSVNDRFLIESNSISSRRSSMLQKDEAKQVISEIQLQSSSKTLKHVYQKQELECNDSEDYVPEIYWYTDLQSLGESTFLQEIKTDVTAVTCVPSERENLYIDSVWFVNPIRSFYGIDSVVVKVKNFGTKNVKGLVLNLKIYNKISQKSVQINAGSSTDISLTYSVPKTKLVEGVVYLEDYPINYDNDFYFAYNIPDEIKVSLITRNDKLAKIVKRVFENDSNVLVNVVRPEEVNYDLVKRSNAVIVGELPKIGSGLSKILQDFEHENGAVLMIAGVESASLLSYNRFLSKMNTCELKGIDTSQVELDEIPVKSKFFSSVFSQKMSKENVKIQMPILYSSWEVDNVNASSNVLWLTTNKTPYLVKNGNFYFITSGLSDELSDFSQHPMVVPLLYKIALSSIISDKPFHYIGKDEVRGVATYQNKEVTVIAPDSTTFRGEFSGVEKQSIRIGKRFTEKGHYLLSIPNGEESIVSLNHQRSESEYSSAPVEDYKRKMIENDHLEIIEGSLHQKKNTAKDVVIGREYWHYVLWIALCFIVIEMLLLFPFKKKQHAL